MQCIHIHCKIYMHYCKQVSLSINWFLAINGHLCVPILADSLAHEYQHNMEQICDKELQHLF